MSTIGSLFSVTYGNKLDMNKMKVADPDSGTAFVGRKGGLAGHSGVSGYVVVPDGVKPYKAGLLTVALGGSRLLSTYVQQRDFITAQNVAVLSPKDTRMPLLHRLYYAMCIRHNAFRYTAFGREANRTLSSIVLPNKVPAWVDECSLQNFSTLSDPVKSRPVALKPSSWAPFRVDQLFKITRGKYIPAAAQVLGATRVITSSRENNGFSKSLDVKPTYDGGQISVARNGSVGEAFYQPGPFFASDDVFVLDPIGFALNAKRALFITALLKAERYRYSYGRKLRVPLLEQTILRLPVHEGDPDWAYIESFMDHLPWSQTVAR